MRAPDIPPNEAARINELRSYQILDSEPDPAFDALTALAAAILKAPIALVSLVDSDRQWFKSHHGLAVTQTPRNISFCGHVVADGKPLIVRDAFADARFADNPLTVGERHVRFYAGMPLKAPSGAVLGTLCVIDYVPRNPTPAELELLAPLVTLAVTELETYRKLAIMRRVVDGVPGMLAYWDNDQRCRFANAAYERWFGVTPEALIGKTMEELLGPLYPLNLPYIEGVLRGEEQAFEREIPNPRGGASRHAQAHYLPYVMDGHVSGFTVMVTDITAGKILQAELSEARARAHALATHDALTGLPNRLLVQERIGRALEHSRRFERRTAILFLDLDGFKAVNDSLGHAAGDSVLREVARRLLATTRSSDTVARLGGDEFLVLLPEVEGAKDAEAVCLKLLRAMADEPILVDGQHVSLSFSIGVALFPEHAASVQGLIARADAALYQAKRSGKNRFACFVPE